MLLRLLLLLLTCFFELLHHFIKFVEFRLGNQRIEIVEIDGQYQSTGAHEIEHVTEALAIAVDKIVLLETVKNDWQRSVEHLGET